MQGTADPFEFRVGVCMGVSTLCASAWACMMLCVSVCMCAVRGSEWYCLCVVFAVSV